MLSHKVSSFSASTLEEEMKLMNFAFTVKQQDAALCIKK